MDLKEFTDLIKIKPYLIKMGKGLLSKRYNISTNDVVRAKREAREHINTLHLPKVLLFDIETAPLKAYVWKLWKTDIHNEQVINDWFCLSWSAKWLYSNKVMGDVVTSEEALKEDDSRIMKNLWCLINNADIVISHNGDRFDIPRINSRFIINGLDPTTPYFSIDTCKIAKKQFGFSSNKLDALATYFNIPNKLHTEFALWKACLEGDKKALGYMLKYNKQDVVILEEVYLKLRPWIKNHPNIGNLDGTQAACANCGSEDIEVISGKYYYTSVGKYETFRCKHCGAISRGRRSVQKYPKLISTSR